MFNPISLRGTILNLGSPVNRKMIPFWHWVTMNIFSLKDLKFLKDTITFVNVTPIKLAYLPRTFDYYYDYGLREL
jgi:hypothetical protein